jgi:hypothetical protein
VRACATACLEMLQYFPASVKEKKYLSSIAQTGFLTDNAYWIISSP